MKASPMHTAATGVDRDNPNGFSLVEVIIAMAILSLAMLAAASMQINSIRNTTSGNIVTQANMLAKAKLEELKNTRDLTTISNGAENGIDSEGQPGGIYDRSWTVDSMGTTARRIKVTVQWNKGSQTRMVSISTNTRGNGV